MAILIKPKRSETASSAPTVSDLAVGEIAINTADQKLYIKDSGGNIRSIGGSNVIQFPYDDTDLGDLSSATQNSDLGQLGGSVSFPDGNYDNLTVHTSLTVNGNAVTGEEITLTDLSVGSEQIASGDGAIAYNNTTGVFTYTPPDLSVYLLAANAFSGSYTDLSNKPTLVTSYNDLTDLPSLFSGSYNDLTNLPSLFDGAYSSLSGTPDLSTYATETYVDNQILSVIDSSPAALDTLNELAAALGDDANFSTTVTNSIATKANSADLSTVATTGAYADLSGTPTLATVATTGSYND